MLTTRTPFEYGVTLQASDGTVHEHAVTTFWSPQHPLGPEGAGEAAKATLTLLDQRHRENSARAFSVLAVHKPEPAPLEGAEPDLVDVDEPEGAPIERSLTLDYLVAIAAGKVAEPELTAADAHAEVARRADGGDDREATSALAHLAELDAD